LAHFPLRSPAQYLTRTVTNTLAYHAMPDRELFWGRNYSEHFEWLKARPEKFESTSYTAALQYAIPNARECGIIPELVEEPLRYLGGRLRYTSARSEMLCGLRAVVAMAEDLAFRYAAFVAHASTEQQDANAVAAQLLNRFQSKANERDRRFAELAARTARAAEDIAKSWTWRCGRLVIGPVRAVQSALQSCINSILPLKECFANGAASKPLSGNKQIPRCPTP